MPPLATVTAEKIPCLVRRLLLHPLPLAVCLDYDGTLVPIAATPEQATPTPRLLQLLQRLGRLPHLHTCIVTGRTMADIRRLLPLDSLDFISDHGAQILSPSRNMLWTHPELVGLTEPVKQAEDLLERRLTGLEGLHLEPKPFSLALHLRNAPPEVRRKATAICRRTAKNLDLAILPGKAVLELRTRAAPDKASGIQHWCRFALPTLPGTFLAAGDDRTDEDTFRLLRNRGLTILVGQPRKTFARWRAPTPSVLLQLLEALADALAEDAAPALSSPPS